MQNIWWSNFLPDVVSKFYFYFGNVDTNSSVHGPIVEVQDP